MAASIDSLFSHRRDDVIVGDSTLRIGQREYPLREITGIRVQSDSAYRGRAIPFALALLCVVWMLGELLNPPVERGYVVAAGVLALFFMAIVRLVGGFQVHTIWLDTAAGEVAVMRSRDGAAVSARVRAMRQALARSGRAYAGAWGVGAGAAALAGDTRPVAG